MLRIEVKKVNKQMNRKQRQQHARLRERVAMAYARSVREENERERQASIYWIKERSAWLHRDAHVKLAEESFWQEVG